MNIEVLVEDRSGGLIMEAVMSKITQCDAKTWRYRIYPHRGCGSIPHDLRRAPDTRESSLLPLLPAKLRAYRRLTRQGWPLIVIVVLDSDAHPREELLSRLVNICHTEGGELMTVIGLATEELEAWMLGDRGAILKAFPEADTRILDDYVQDSVCGTWEVLARAIMGDTAEDLIAVGYPAVGKYKYNWAERIAPLMDLEANRSPSFRGFYQKLTRTMEAHAQRMRKRSLVRQLATEEAEVDEEHDEFEWKGGHWR